MIPGSMRRKAMLLSVLGLGMFMTGCSSTPRTSTQGNEMNIIPKPNSVELRNGHYEFSPAPTIFISPGISNGDFFQEILTGLIPGLQSSTDPNAELRLILEPDTDLPAEGYRLEITVNGILISAGDEPGVFYGIQSLRQLLPPVLEGGGVWTGPILIPLASINDHPRFAWRGMHLDVSRHFFPTEFVKQYIDMIALHKMNVFHWHLTDDNGWRLEIKKYPKLTEVCAWRVDRENEGWRDWSPIQPGEASSYGGFYTQEEVREIVAYAAARQITVIPEIEMPGHSSELFAAYPEFSCRGETLPVRPGSYWPNKDILCAGNDSVFSFLEGVIDEVVELFPAKYIHIGGDEATKTNWETCPKCQARIQVEGLANEHELQSWFIRKMERYIRSKGKQIIGWDEILEGGLAPEATVMSWRGMAGGIAAAKAGHDVIMAPTSHCYFDYYQGDPATEPKAIGGYVPLNKVYSYDPIPEALEPTEYKYILGSQANLWTEFIKTPEHAEYMVLPRMSALAEVVWSAKADRNWLDFHTRLGSLLQRFDALGWNYSKGSFLVEIIPGRMEGSGAIQFDLLCEKPEYQLRYTTDGSDPGPESPLYAGTLSVDQDVQVRAAVFDGKHLLGRIARRDFAFHQALDKKTRYQETYSPWYRAGGDQGLVDGILGSEDHKDGTWQGFEGNDLELTIDLGAERAIFRTEMNFLQSRAAWIFMPQFIEVSLSSDGESWHLVSHVDNEVSVGDEQIAIHRLSADFPSTRTRYVKVLAKNRGVCPEDHPGAGDLAWIFCDEVLVR